MKVDEMRNPGRRRNAGDIEESEKIPARPRKHLQTLDRRSCTRNHDRFRQAQLHDSDQYKQNIDGQGGTISTVYTHSKSGGE